MQIKVAPFSAITSSIEVVSDVVNEWEWDKHLAM